MRLGAVRREYLKAQYLPAHFVISRQALITALHFQIITPHF